MSLALEIVNNIYGFSLAKYATWLYYKPDNLLLDVGEGVSVAMRNMIYGINAIAISHGHGDHIAGLPGLLRSRASSMGDKAKPLTIYYPKDDRSINKLCRYIKDTVGKLSFDICWQELIPEQRISLSANRYLVPFASNHGEANTTLGYKIVEHRTRLKEEYRLVPQAQLLQIIQQQGKLTVSEAYDHILLCFSGDSMALEPKICEHAEVLIHDSTFLKIEDRDENTHATLQEAIATAKQAQVSVLGLFHFSARYRHSEIVESLNQIIQQQKITIPIFYIFSNPNPAIFRKLVLSSNQSQISENVTPGK